MTKPLLALVWLLTLAAPLRADPIADEGRKLIAKHQTSVLTVEIQLRQSLTMGTQEQKGETKVTTFGSLLDTTGLLAISLSTIDPSNLQKAGNPNARNLHITSEVADAKILLADSTEIPVEVIYRDNDLDLAFIRTKQPLPGNLTPFDLTKPSKPAVLDEAYVLWRLGAIAKRTLAIQTGRILACVDKPRPYYLYEHANWQNTLGSPVLALDGKLIGLILMRYDTGTGASRGALPIIIPVDDIRESVAQAREAMKKKAADKPAGTK
jgi:hypothetical protein